MGSSACLQEHQPRKMPEQVSSDCRARTKHAGRKGRFCPAPLERTCDTCKADWSYWPRDKVQECACAPALTTAKGHATGEWLRDHMAAGLPHNDMHECKCTSDA